MYNYVIMFTFVCYVTLTHVHVPSVLTHLSSLQVLYQTRKQQLFFLSFPSWVSSVNYNKKLDYDINVIK